MDGLAAVGIVAAAIGLCVFLTGIQQLLQDRRSRPVLPLADRPPAGLGRLVPVGSQVEEECRRGVIALESWLLSHRSPGRGGV